MRSSTKLTTAAAADALHRWLLANVASPAYCASAKTLAASAQGDPVVGTRTGEQARAVRILQKQ